MRAAATVRWGRIWATILARRLRVSPSTVRRWAKFHALRQRDEISVRAVFARER